MYLLFIDKVVEWATLYTLAPAHNATLAHFDKQDLVMRNANSDVDIYSTTANTDT